MDPLLHPEDRELEAELRRAGRDVTLSPAAQERLLAALGVAAGVTVAGEAAASTSFVSKLLASKSMLTAASMVSVGAIGAGVYFTRSAEPPSDRPPVSRPAETVHAATPTGAAAATDREAPSDAAVATERDATASADSTVEKGPALQPRTGSRKPAADVNAAFRDELALVESLSRAVKAGNGSLALAHSAEYKRKFPRGKLGLEAQVLHIEALALAGNRSEASRLAQGFLKRYPDSPIAARIRRFAH